MKSALVIFFVLACMLLANCSPRNNSQSAIFAGNSSGIVNGALVTKADPLAKHLVMLTNGYRIVCTGTLIAKDIVLTAAHCYEDGKLYVAFSVDGTSENIAKLRPHLVTAHKIPEGYVPPVDDAFESDSDVLDIMVIKFNNGTPDGFVPAELLESESIYPPEIAADKVITAFGYGVTDGIKQTGVGPLRKVRLTIEEPFFGRTEFSASIEGSATCQGDSGGPVFIRVGDKQVVAGVTSRGDVGCTGTGYYTKVNAYTDWIKATIKEFSATN
jgi:hypothetical protein